MAGKKFDMEKYKSGDAEVICEKCGSRINLGKTTRTRKIAEDMDGFDVIKQFFSCECCGEHYTITVIDRGQQKMIQRRQQLNKQIRLYESIRSREKTIRDLRKKEERLKADMLKRALMLKERYMKECKTES